MPIHRIINTEYYSLFVWHIQEEASELATLLEPYKNLALHGMTADMQQKALHNSQFLSTRLLCFQYAGMMEPIVKDAFGKPHSNGLHVSITHSHDYTAVIVSEKHKVGIDLERIDPRIHKVAHKFMHDEEYFFDADEQTEGITLVWSAKETLYKVYSEREVIFKDELRIHPFHTARRGTFRGDIRKGEPMLGLPLHYTYFHDYILTWCAG